MLRATANLQITIIGLAVVVVLGSLALFGLPSESVPERPPDSLTPQASEASGRIAVHISGAVVAPGLVELPDGSRIADAVSAAGGLPTMLQ